MLDKNTNVPDTLKCITLIKKYIKDSYYYKYQEDIHIYILAWKHCKLISLICILNSNIGADDFAETGNWFQVLQTI